MRAWIVGSAVLTVASGCCGRCSSPGNDPPPSNGSPNSAAEIQLISLGDSLEPLKARFNAHMDKLRFVAIVSPT